jgi:hypothetical protein
VSLNKLLKTPHATAVNDKGEPLKPTEAWTPSVVENGDGTINLTTVKPTSEGRATFDDLIRAEGYDPAEYMVTRNGVQVKSWDALRRVWVEDDSERGGHHETEKTPMRGYKLTIVKRPYGAVDVDELAELVTSNKPSPEQPRRGGKPLTYLFAAGDQQWSKADGDGLEGQVERHREVTRKAAEEAKNNPEVTDVLIVFTGDACELFASQGGKNAWRTTLTVTEQLRLMRRMYLWTIDQFIDAGFKNVKVVAVPSNHGRMHDTMVKTRVDDNFDVDGLIAVADAMELNPERYGGVQCYVPRNDEQHVALEVNGLNITVMHGDAWRPGQHWKFWESHAFGQTDIGKSRVLLCGHGHHLHIEERDVRTFIMTPALEEVSSWWKQKTGTTGHPGAVSALIYDGEIEMIHKIHATYRGTNVHDHT